MNKLLFLIGNTLIIISLAGFVFIFYPFIIVYLFPTPIVQNFEATEGLFITIPKINAQAKIIERIDPWNQAAYNEALKHGVAHARGTSLPGEKGTSFLFAHSSSNPWDLTRINTIFLRLGELHTGDIIEIVKDGKEMKYTVTDKKEVDPTEVSYLLHTSKDQLILQTCTPIGTSLRRLLVFAQPTN